ncbi:GTP-binding protein LepA [Kribbella sp. NPDC020789]
MRRTERKLAEHVEKLAEQHPPIDLAGVDYTVADPVRVAQRFGPALTYMARVELEVERNVLELEQLLPDPPDIDRHFYTDVWLPQETQHGLVLDHFLMLLGFPRPVPDTSSVSFRLKLLGRLGKRPAIQDISRMLYYLTGMATERSAVLAYNALHDGLLELGERAAATTIIAPIRKQEPGHFAYYRIAATGLWAQLMPWQRWLVRRLRTRTFTPVGVGTAVQQADFGTVMHSLGISSDDQDLRHFARQIGRVERELLWAGRQGIDAPVYIIEALRRAKEASRTHYGFA